MKLKSLAVLSASVMVLAACGNGESNEGKKSSNSDDSKQTTEEVIALNDINTKPEDAIKKAKDEYSGQDLTEIAYEKSNGDWVYKISQQKTGEESEVTVADKDQKVLDKSDEKEDSVDKQDSFNYDDAIDYKEAINKAKDKFDGDIKEWSLDKDDGKLVYNMDLQKDNTKHEITVDAKNGKVLKNEKDD